MNPFNYNQIHHLQQLSTITPSTLTASTVPFANNVSSANDIPLVNNGALSIPQFQAVEPSQLVTFVVND